MTLPSALPLLLTLDTLLSLLTFALYALDKAAAANQRRRVAERTLHLLTLAGGWPGALLGQRLLRHKTRKTSFQLIFWLCVAGNLGLTTLFTAGF